MLHNYFHVDPGPGAHNGSMTGHYSGLLASWSSSNPLTSVFTRDRWKLILTVASSERSGDDDQVLCTQITIQLSPSQ